MVNWDSSFAIYFLKNLFLSIYIYIYINVNVAKLGSKAGNFICRNNEREEEGDIEVERERDRLAYVHTWSGFREFLIDKR